MAKCQKMKNPKSELKKNGRYSLILWCFEKLFEIFKELITYTSGDFDEAINWLSQLDSEYKLTDAKYTVDDFVEDLKKKGYVREEIDSDGNGGNISFAIQILLFMRALFTR